MKNSGKPAQFELAIAINSHKTGMQTIRRSDYRPMYTCICNAIRETDLRSAAVKSAGDAESVYASLGKKPNCRQCLVKAGQIISSERAQCSAALSCEKVAV